MTVQDVHSTEGATAGLRMARSLSSNEGEGFLGTYQSGPVFIVVLQSATPEIEHAVASLQGLQRVP